MRYRLTTADSALVQAVECRHIQEVIMSVTSTPSYEPVSHSALLSISGERAIRVTGSFDGTGMVSRHEVCCETIHSRPYGGGCYLWKKDNRIERMIAM